MNNWLTDKLVKRIREVFEPRYKRPLTEKEIIAIAENLSCVTEELLKLKWRQKYG